MPRETKHSKAMKILAERRLTVETVGDPSRPGFILARCRGETSAEIYALGYRPDKKRWGCTCEANSRFRQLCSHLLSLQMVVVGAETNGNGAGLKAISPHVKKYIGRCLELGVMPPQRVIDHLAREVRKLEDEGCSKEQIESGVLLLADKGSSPTILPYLSVEALRKKEGSDVRRFVAAHGWPTGCRIVRGSHGLQPLYDPLGTARPPANWPHGRPSKEEIEKALNEGEPVAVDS